MREAHLRVWFAPKDKGGQKIIEQIVSAIETNDKLLLVLSEASLHSDWVMTEMRRALAEESKRKLQKLFPSV